MTPATGASRDVAGLRTVANETWPRPLEEYKPITVQKGRGPEEPRTCRCAAARVGPALTEEAGRMRAKHVTLTRPSVEAGTLKRHGSSEAFQKFVNTARSDFCTLTQGGSSAPSGQTNYQGSVLVPRGTRSAYRSNTTLSGNLLTDHKPAPRFVTSAAGYKK